MTSGKVTRLDLGLYEAARAAALSGVPERTIYHWAKIGLVPPSAPGSRPMLWSYGDLLTLRLVRWLRLDKPKRRIARTKMEEVRSMLTAAGDDLWQTAEDGRDVATILVTPSGRVILTHGPGPRTVDGQLVLDGGLDLFAPFGSGVDLRRPRPKIRIHPGRLSGQPHLLRSRLTSLSVAALAVRGMSLDDIHGLYPGEDRAALAEAIDLERDLATPDSKAA